ncbi:6-bladed beta-propeller [Roseivirga sp. E12]|uniref:6-bladed beta-propeller n=1 Tax=Roseivirga sp. E12 TaxID=2819237 RepID=UPI001ABCA34A|nr:6-bladed beta-propeller [Roseivirga sp. E12]MBO3699815.1 6-bladed beta-propeller [Roseivirga sp. E12]
MKPLTAIFLVCSLCIASLCCCDSRQNVVRQEKTEEGMLLVDPNKADVTPFASLFKDLRVLELKSPSEYNLAIISKVDIDGRAIYALDRVFSRRINKYNFKGELQSSFSVYDSDTLNLKNIDDFYLLEESIFILDSEGKQVFELNSDLKIRNRFHFSFSAHKLAVSNTQFYFFRNEFAYNLEDESYFYNYINTDLEGSISYTKYPFTIELGTKLRLSVKESFSRSSDNIYYTQWLTDTIFRATKSGLEKAYIVDFGEKKARGSLMQNPEKVKEKLMADPTAFASGICFFLEESEFLSFQYVYNGGPHYFYLDKETGNSFISNFISFEGNFVPFPVGHHKERFIAAIDEYQIEQGFYNELEGIDIYNEVVNNGRNYVVTYDLK